MTGIKGLIVSLVAALGLAAPALAAETTPEALVKQIYSGKTPTTKGLDIFNSPKLQAKYLSKDLAAAVKKDSDESAKSGDIGALDFDPVSDSQDPMIKDLKIEPVTEDGDKAQVKVSFKTYDPGRDELLYDLVREGGQWHVFNISKPGGGDEAWSLRSILSLK